MRTGKVVYFHIGGHKTGTTYLQHVLWSNREALRRDGVLFPGRRQPDHVWASIDLRETSFKNYRAPEVAGAWGRLAAEVQAWDGPAVIDHELFSLCLPAHIDRAMHDLAPAEVHVLFTARDMARQLPAAWQEWIKNRDVYTFAEFLSAVQQPASPESRRLMSLHDWPEILRRWSKAVPAERVHLITVPPAGAAPGLLWQRFAGVIGLDPARYDTDAGTANTSLGAAEVAVLRRLNIELAPYDIPWPVYDRRVKHGLAPAIGARSGLRIELPQAAYDWALGWAKQAVEDVRGAGYDIVGDLAELIPTQRPTGQDPDAVPAEAALPAAVAGMAALLLQSEGRRPGAPVPAKPTLSVRARRYLLRRAGELPWLARLLAVYRRVRR